MIRGVASVSAANTGHQRSRSVNMKNATAEKVVVEYHFKWYFDSIQCIRYQVVLEAIYLGNRSERHITNRTPFFFIISSSF